MESQELVSCSRQCSRTLVSFGQGFLSNEQCDNTGASPYSPDLTPAASYLFPRLKSALKGLCFWDATDIIQNEMEEFTGLSQNGFQECFHHLNSHWQTCIVAQRDYFEGWLYCFVIFRNKVILGTFWSCHIRCTTATLWLHEIHI